MTTPFTAADLCTRTVVFADKGMMVGEAARLMRTHGVGSLVVIEERSPARRMVVGMVTDRDIATAVVGGDRDPHAYRVGDIMSADVVSVREQDTMADVLEVMRRKRVRRAPVTGPQGELIGIISLDDILSAIAEQMHALANAITASGRHEA